MTATTATAPQMKRNIADVFHDLIGSWVLWATLLCWAAEALMNGFFGWRTVHFFVGALLVGIAVFGAYASIRFFQVRGWGWWDWGYRAMYAVPLLICLAVSQVAGWFSLGTLFADGFTLRETKATSRSTAAEDLQRARDQRANLGTQRAIGAIKADLDLELRRTSKQYPNGDGPNAKKLKGELANAELAAKLEEKIPELLAGLEGREQVAAGTPHLEVLKRWTGAAPADIAFWVPVVLTGFIGFFANFGFPLAGVGAGHDPRTAHAAPLAGYLPRERDVFDDIADHDPRIPPHLRHGAYAFQQPPEYPMHRPYSGYGYNPAGGQNVSMPGEHEPARSPVSHAAHQPAPVVMQSPAPANPHNPITINVGGATSNGGALPGSQSGAVAGPGRRLLTRGRGAALPTVRDRPAGNTAEATPATPDAAQRPVDRNPLNEVCDHLLTFKAACLVDEDGALVPAPDMLQRYQAWAGGRAIHPASFDTLFGTVTGLQRVDLSGVQHWHGVSLRAGTQLVKVS